MTLDAEGLRAMYARAADPWGFRRHFYEQRKRALTVASLPAARFTSAFEPGCSIGLLTRELAPRCDRLLATDLVPAAVDTARTEVVDQPHVQVEVMTVPQQWPTGTFDLIVLSELGYYLAEADLDRLVGLLRGALTPDGTVVACHWRHPVAEHVRGGDEVHERLLAASGLVPLARHLEEDFLLDVLVPPPARSVARRSGLVT